MQLVGAAQGTESSSGAKTHSLDVWTRKEQGQPYIGQACKLKPSKGCDCHICNSDEKNLHSESKQFSIFHTAAFINKEAKIHTATGSFVNAFVFLYDKNN